MKRTLLLALFLSSTSGTAFAVPVDRDGDGLPDRWEKRHSLNTHIDDSRRDPDHDRLNNIREFRRKTDPRNSDTDNDSLRDGDEIRKFGTNPRKVDSDDNGILDGQEDRDGNGIRNEDESSQDSSSSSSEGSASSEDRSAGSSSSRSGSSSSDD